jgi:hypothetical protein
MKNTCEILKPITFLISSHTIIISKNMSSLTPSIFGKRNIFAAELQTICATAEKWATTHSTILYTVAGTRKVRIYP